MQLRRHDEFLAGCHAIVSLRWVVRALRSGIQMTDMDHPPKVFQLTSTLLNEGKTTIALSLATERFLWMQTCARHRVAR
jgi:hypothetical protein